MTTVSYRDFTGTAAENYQRWFVPSIATPVSTVLLRAADLKPGERVLDVACGTGVVTRLAAERVGPEGAVTGVDIAPDMIEVARSVPAAGAPAIDWRIADAAALPLADGAFDVVLCQMGLMFMEDRATALAEMRRVLAPGGRVVVVTPGAIQPTFEIMESAIVEHISPELGRFVRAVFSMHDPRVVGRLVTDAGFGRVTGDVSTVTLHLPPPAEFLWQYINLTPIGPAVAAAPEAARLAVERQVVEGWQPYVTAAGTTEGDQPMVVVAGRA